MDWQLLWQLVINWPNGSRGNTVPTQTEYSLPNTSTIYDLARQYLHSIIENILTPSTQQWHGTITCCNGSSWSSCPPKNSSYYLFQSSYIYFFVVVSFFSFFFCLTMLHCTHKNQLSIYTYQLISIFLLLPSNKNNRRHHCMFAFYIYITTKYLVAI